MITASGSSSDGGGDVSLSILTIINFHLGNIKSRGTHITSRGSFGTCLFESSLPFITLMLQYLFHKIYADYNNKPPLLKGAVLEVYQKVLFFL